MAQSRFLRQIRPSDIQICLREDGSEWLLGSGSFGEVGWWHAVPSIPSNCLHHARRACICVVGCAKFGTASISACAPGSGRSLNAVRIPCGQVYKGMRFRVQEVAVKRPAPALRTVQALARLQEEVQVSPRRNLTYREPRTPCRQGVGWKPWLRLEISCCNGPIKGMA